MVEPQVHIDVVGLDRTASSILLQARASDNQELVIKAADGMSVARQLKRVLRKAVKFVCAIIENFKARCQGLCIRLLEIATTNHEKALGRRLDVLEVVLKVSVHVDLASVDSVSSQVELK